MAAALLLWWTSTHCCHCLRPWQGTPKDRPKEGMGEIMVMTTDDSGRGPSAPTPVSVVVLGCSFEHGRRGWRQRWWQRRLASDGGSRGRGRSGGGKANVQRMHSLLNGVMWERDVILIFFFFLPHKIQTNK
jgi:hypothetical protein